MDFDSSLTPTQGIPSKIFIFDGDQWLVRFENKEFFGLSTETPGLAGVQEFLGAAEIEARFEPLYFGTTQGESKCNCYVINAEPSRPKGLRWKTLRQVFDKIDGDELGLAMRAVQYSWWRNTHQFCGRCGTGTQMSDKERLLVCPECGLSSYPRLSPSMIVLIEKGDEILLGRSPKFPPGFLSVIAGFVEPGETVEETVHREVLEETGLKVKNIRYFGSQPWPFPDSLMLGYFAEYESGELVLEDEELVEAGWYGRDHMPHFPGEVSIAGRMIKAWLNKEF